jgi:hypothetical protein
VLSCLVVSRRVSLPRLSPLPALKGVRTRDLKSGGTVDDYSAYRGRVRVFDGAPALHRRELPVPEEDLHHFVDASFDDTDRPWKRFNRLVSSASLSFLGAQPNLSNNASNSFSATLFNALRDADDLQDFSWEKRHELTKQAGQQQGQAGAAKKQPPKQQPEAEHGTAASHSQAELAVMDLSMAVSPRSRARLEAMYKAMDEKDFVYETERERGNTFQFQRCSCYCSFVDSLLCIADPFFACAWQVMRPVPAQAHPRSGPAADRGLGQA